MGYEEYEEYEKLPEDKLTISEKVHKALRIAQWLIPALITFYGTLDISFGWGRIETVGTIGTGLVTLIGVIAEHSSKTYFKAHEIVDKEG